MSAFENDSAADWIGVLEEAEGLEAIEDAFGATETEDYVEIDQGSAAIAAAEVVAALGGARTDLPDEVRAWVERQEHRPSPALRQRALTAVDRVAAADSELAELWDEADDGAEWRAAIAGLRGRLAPAT